MSRYWDSNGQRWVYPSPPPSDYQHPDWTQQDRVHNWRNYISERLQAMWDTFTDEQKAAIAEGAQEAADREDWD